MGTQRRGAGPGALSSRRSRHRGERGTTLLEVMVVSTLMVVVFATLLGVFDSFSGAALDHEASLDARSSARQAMAGITRDLRAADPLHPVAGAADAETEVVFGIEGDAGPTTLRWVYDVAQGRLTREVLSGPGGSTVSERLVLEGMENSAEGLVAFEYFHADGTQLVPGQATALQIADCTARIHITLAVARADGREPYVSESDVSLRSREGTTPC